MPRAPTPIFAPILPALPLSDDEAALLAPLSVTEKLILSQAVYELGSAGDFKNVSQILQSHALLMGAKGKGGSWGADKCKTVFEALLKDIGYAHDVPYPPNAPVLLQLAKKYYALRVFELREVIQLEEDKFRTMFREIEEIREGKWDDRMDLLPAVPSEADAKVGARRSSRSSLRSSEGVAMDVV